MEDASKFQREFFRRLDDPLSVLGLFEHLNEVIFYAKNADSQFITGNQLMLYMHGCQTVEEVIGRSDYDFHPRDLADQYVAEDRRVMAGGVAVPNQLWLVPDFRGELKWYISTKVPLRGDGGRVIGLAGVMRDIEQFGSVLAPYRELDEVVKFVLRNYGQRIEVGQLAELAGLSVSQFDRKFKRAYQMTPQQYIQRVRLNSACQALLTTKKTAAEIALECGFYDQSYFTRQFLSRVGMTPNKYRRAYARDVPGE